MTRSPTIAEGTPAPDSAAEEPPATELGALAATAGQYTAPPVGDDDLPLMQLSQTGETERVGRYEVVGVLGRGGMGVVYEVVDNESGAVLALKTIETRFLALPDANAVQRFQQEINVLKRLDHPSIVHLFDTGFAKHPMGYEVAYLVMERLDGCTLDEQLKAGKRWAPDEALRIIADLTEALRYLAENGVLHRDIKPANVFLDGTDRVVLMDFGLARSEEFTRLTLAGQIVGTLGYMSPERLCGKPVDVSSDIYALGVVLYQMLTGKHPFGTGSPSDLVAAIQGGIKWADDFERIPKGAQLRDLLARMLHASAERRPAPEDLRRRCLALRGPDAADRTAAPISDLLREPPSTRPRPPTATWPGDPGASAPVEPPASASRPRPAPAFAASTEHTGTVRSLFVHPSGPTWAAFGLGAVAAACGAFLIGVVLGRAQAPIAARPLPAAPVPVAAAPAKPPSSPKVATPDTKPAEAPQPARAAAAPALPKFSGPGSAKRYAKKALDKDDVPTAIAALELLVETEQWNEWTNAENYLQLGDLHLRLNQNPQAVQHYKTYLALKPRARNAQVIEGIIARLER